MKTILAVMAALILLAAWTYQEDGCTTDSECARLCPVEDLDCDGGPQ